MTTATLPDAVSAHILARISEKDVPVNVAADIDQIITDQEGLIEPSISFAIYGKDADGQNWALTDDFASEADADAFIARSRWMRKSTDVHVVRLTTVEYHLPSKGPAS
jgi:hypothetical protein